MNLARLRGFLLQLPKPAKIRVTCGDGEPQEIKPGRSYARTAESIAALGVDLVECLDSEGVVLRALRLSDSDAHRSDAAPVPTGIEADPQALMLTHFANLLHRAYEHSTEVAFTRLVELAERLSSHTESIEARLAQTEAALRRAQTDQIDDALERAQAAIEAGGGAGAGGDLMQQMAGAWLQGKMQQAASPAPKPNGARNGKV
jgi:hypothetical protein